MGKVNELCRKLREDAGLSVTELAAALGVHKSTVSSIELGRYNVSLNTAKKYADLFGKKYEPDLTKHLIRYDCGEKINQLLKARGITQKRFANALGIPYGTAAVLLARGTGSNGILARGVFEEEIPVLARYFHVEESEFRINKYYTDTVGVSTTPKLTDKVKVIDPAPDAPKPKKTAQMICEEEKKMEYEEALKKAKDVDILKEENDHLKKDCDEWSMMYNAQRGRIDELEKANEQYKDIEKERDKAVDAYDNLSNLYGSLSKEAKEKDALINELSKINQDLKKKVDSVDYALASDYKTVSAELARYKDILLEILLEQRKAK